jgi:hypothetical protein
MEQRSETTREEQRRSTDDPDTRTPGISREGKPHADERDPKYASTSDLRRRSRPKGGATGG